MDIPQFIEAMIGRHARLVDDARRLRSDARGSDLEDRALAVLEALTDAVVFHVQREERFLFPGILAVVEGDDDGVFSTRGTIATIESEHEELTVLERRMRELVPSDHRLTSRIVMFLDAFEAHNEAEDGQLFPAVKDLLDRRDAIRESYKAVAK